MNTLHRRRLSWKEPKNIANALINQWGEKGFIWLDGDGSSLGRWVTIATNPIEEICCRGLPNEDNSSNPFEKLRNLNPGHWTGWLSYEAGAWIEPAHFWKKDAMATLWIASHDPVLKFDLLKHELWIEGTTPEKIQRLSDWINTVKVKENTQGEISTNLYKPIPIKSWKWVTNKNMFTKKVGILKELIANGDIFQANLSTSCITDIPTKSSAFKIYQRIRKTSPSPFSGLVIGNQLVDKEAIISTSPERFLQISSNGNIETRPIKGTRPRASNPIKDAEYAAELITSIKDRAENIMIVDLLRNDLGKVCQPGSIHVTQLAGLESYNQVHHLTSVVKGSLLEDKTWVDALEACWPGGSITGAPKIRACKRLHELEPTARGPYCGSLIHVGWDGSFDSNILIRSLMINGSTMRANAGCGIVADSDAKKEAEELTWKLLPILKALE